MTKKINLIGKYRSQKLIQEVAHYLKDKGYEASVFLQELPLENLSEESDGDLTILFLIPGIEDETYRYVYNRYKHKKYTLIIFSEPIALGKDRRALIGRNDAVFLTADKDDYLAEISELIEKAGEFEFVESGLNNNISWSENESSDSVEAGSSRSKNYHWWIVAVLIGIVYGIYRCTDNTVSTQEVEELHNAWDQYLSDTYAGQILATVGEALLKQTPQQFNQFGYDNFIEGVIKPSKNITWGDISPVIHDITINYPTPADLTPIMAEDLRTAVYNASNSDYNLLIPAQWNPVYDLSHQGTITIRNINVANQSRYVLTYDDDIEMVMALDNGEWKIADFALPDASFIKEVNAYLYQSERTNSTKYYTGTVSNPRNPFLISLTLNYTDSQKISGVYRNIATNETIDIDGFANSEETFFSGSKDGQTIAFMLTPQGTEILSGTVTFEQNGEDSIFDVILKESQSSTEPELVQVAE